MSDPGPSGAPGDPGAPSEEELRAAYEAELSRITSTDMIAQATVSLLNIAARRLGPPGGPAGAQEQAADRDLEQARDAIDAAGALLSILERRIPQDVRSLRDALSQLQMAYAREVGAGAEPGGGEGGPGGQSGGGEGGPGGAERGAPPEQGRRPGPAESSGRLWVPGG